MKIFDRVYPVEMVIFASLNEYLEGAKSRFEMNISRLKATVIPHNPLKRIRNQFG